MSHASRKQIDAQEVSIPYVEPDSCEEQTEPRIRTQLLIPAEQSGVVARAPSAVTQVQHAIKRFRFAPALVIGALIGSAPYLVQQHLRSSSLDDLRALSQAHAQNSKDTDVETTQLAAANAPGSVAPQLYAAAAAQPSPEQPLLPSASQPIAAPSYLKLTDDADSVEHPAHRVRDARHSKLSLERALLGLARRQLKLGDGMGAQLALERLNRALPQAAQTPQRKLLEIQVLLAIGAKDRARAAARDFARAYPHSPKLAKLSGLLLGS